MQRAFFPIVLSFLAAACSAGGSSASGLPGDAEDMQPFSAIGAEETIHLTGTEPFWGGTVAAGTLTYTTPDNIDGERIAVERFAGRAGLSFSGQRNGAPLTLMVTQGSCSDAMSDRTYPFTATIKLGEEVRSGCAWTDTKSYDGPENP
jgi:uncharacterized membrane protein